MRKYVKYWTDAISDMTAAEQIEELKARCVRLEDSLQIKGLGGKPGIRLDLVEFRVVIQALQKRLGLP